MKLRVIQKLLILLLFIVITSLCCYGEEKALYLLQIEAVERKGALLHLPVRAGDRFYLYYIHSSDKTPVLDTFLIDLNGECLLVEEAYLWYGAGLEFQNHQGARVVQEDGWVRVRLRRPMPSLFIRVGRISHQVFIFGDQYIPLAHLATPGEVILLSIKKRI
ncbi:MAG: DUF1850 domain-containing protein [Candidatus Anstonellales archaeon]